MSRIGQKKELSEKIDEKESKIDLSLDISTTSGVAQKSFGYVYGNLVTNRDTQDHYIYVMQIYNMKANPLKVKPSNILK